MNKIILITGATSGFGKAIAEKFAASNWNLIITGRRKERLTLIAKELSSTYGVEVLPLVFDVQDKNAVFTTITGMPEKWKKIDVLVNNAGLALGFAVDALSKSMRIDLLQHKIKVTAIHPGAVETEFSLVRFNGDAEKAAAVYKGYTPLSASDIADTVYYCASLPEHVCINELIIMPTAQANANLFYKE